jgi:hypothetical protein
VPACRCSCLGSLSLLGIVIVVTICVIPAAIMIIVVSIPVPILVIILLIASSILSHPIVTGADARAVLIVTATGAQHQQALIVHVSTGKLAAAVVILLGRW